MSRGSPSALAIPGVGIYVFHQGYQPAPGGLVDPSGNGYMYSSYFDGQTWGPDVGVPNGLYMSFNPAAVAFPQPAGALAVFHAEGPPHPWFHPPTIWYSYFDGRNWENDTQVPNVIFLGGGTLASMGERWYFSLPPRGNFGLGRTWGRNPLVHVFQWKKLGATSASPERRYVGITLSSACALVLHTIEVVIYNPTV